MRRELAIQGNSRRLAIRHATTYAYDRPVHRSLHYVHHCPRNSAAQTLLSHRLTVEPAVCWESYEDIHGNPIARFEVIGPFDSLMIVVEFTVELAGLDPFNIESSSRSTFPLSWGVPGDSHLASYLDPAGFDPIGGEEVAAYAQSFAQRNRLDVLETAFDINLTLFREFQYRPGTTTVSTPAIEVLRTRQGVCQDFANLFISLARHLRIPARYVCGYLHPRAASGERSEATHAWVQLFLPGIGWRDFDPTNGILPTDGHVALACGPSYRDAAPIWGTLHSPAMVKETMSVDVRVTSTLN